jgi:hypothetical protein
MGHELGDLVTYLVCGSVVPIAIGMLLVIGVTLTMAPVVYQALEKIEMFKVAAVLLLIVVASVFAIEGSAWADAPQIVTRPGLPAEELGFALLMGALAFAGAGGGQNLCQSNWIRDKRFGMGAYVPRIVSPVTGQPEAAPSTGFVFESTPENLRRWRRWWRFANIEQLTTFVLISFLTIMFTSLLAYATVFGREGLTSDISFLQVEGRFSTTASVTGSARSPGSSGRSRCSLPRSASWTTPAGSAPMSSRPRTSRAQTRARSTSR